MTDQEEEDSKEEQGAQQVGQKTIQFIGKVVLYVFARTTYDS